MKTLKYLLCVALFASLQPIYAQNVGVGTDNPLEFFSVGASSQFRVNSQGNLVMINNVQYSFPASNSSGTLVNNGTGTLSWTNAPSLAVTNFTGTLPALNASNLTNLNAANLSGTLPAISGTNLTNLNASNLSSGTVATARLGTGTASSTTFLRGDGSWQTPAGGGGTTLTGSVAFSFAASGNTYEVYDITTGDAANALTTDFVHVTSNFTPSVSNDRVIGYGFVPSNGTVRIVVWRPSILTTFSGTFLYKIIR